MPETAGAMEAVRKATAWVTPQACGSSTPRLAAILMRDGRGSLLPLVPCDTGASD